MKGTSSAVCRSRDRSRKQWKQWKHRVPSAQLAPSKAQPESSCDCAHSCRVSSACSSGCKTHELPQGFSYMYRGALKVPAEVLPLREKPHFPVAVPGWDKVPKSHIWGGGPTFSAVPTSRLYQFSSGHWFLSPYPGRREQSLARSRRDAAKCCDKCAELQQRLAGNSKRSFGFRVSRTRISSPPRKWFCLTSELWAKAAQAEM